MGEVRSLKAHSDLHNVLDATDSSEFVTLDALMVSHTSGNVMLSLVLNIKYEGRIPLILFAIVTHPMVGDHQAAEPPSTALVLRRTCCPHPLLIA